MLQDDINLIRERLAKAKKIAIYAHIRPDGDSVGSSLGLGRALMDAGKQVQFVCEDPIPVRFAFLFPIMGFNESPYVPEPDADVDCVITPDISSPDRCGDYYFSHPDRRADICIDHHISNVGYAKLNWVEGETPAACYVITGILEKLGLKFTPAVASALLCGLITDTNSFSTSNVNSEAFRRAAFLVDQGADVFNICHNAYKVHNAEDLALWKLGMAGMRVEDGGLIWTSFSRADREAAGIHSDEDAGFVSYMLNTVGMKVSVLFTELDPCRTKISWRGLPGYDVSKLAVSFGGGGHKAASGATLNCGLEDTIRQVLERTRQIL